MELWPGGPITLPHRFSHGRSQLTVPAVPTTTLLDLLAADDWRGFYPGLIPDEQFDVETGLRYADPTDVHFDWHQFHWVATTLLGRIAGTARPRPAPWQHDTGYNAARMLATTCRRHWPDFAAWCAATGFRDAPTRPLWEVTAAVYAWLLSLNPSPEWRQHLEEELWPLRRLPDPPPDEPAPDTPALPAAPGPARRARKRGQVPAHLLAQARRYAEQEAEQMRQDTRLGRVGT